ncbi:MAG: hypothetical protein LBF86_00915 [Helicobacteraceae bacterium]|jgi:hypothetical protein|nr:hypothetical protein [Helicobacteraceae bacterium]
MGYKAVGSLSLPELGIQNKRFNVAQLVKIAHILEVDISRLFDGIWDELDANDPLCPPSRLKRLESDAALKRNQSPRRVFSLYFFVR